MTLKARVHVSAEAPLRYRRDPWTHSTLCNIDRGLDPAIPALSVIVARAPIGHRYRDAATGLLRKYIEWPGWYSEFVQTTWREATRAGVQRAMECANIPLGEPGPEADDPAAAQDAGGEIVPAHDYFEGRAPPGHEETVIDTGKTRFEPDDRNEITPLRQV